MNNDKIRLSIVKTPEKVFVQCLNGHTIADYDFDGQRLLPSFKSGWYILPQYPITKIETEQPQPSINHRYEIRDRSLISDKFKEVYTAEEFEDSDGDIKPQHEHLKSLYRYTYDTQLPITVKLEFEIEVMEEFEQIREINGFKYPVQKTRKTHDGLIDLTHLDVSYDLITELCVPGIAKHMFPCKLTSAQSYKLIRQYVKENIDHKYAEISSDYDFCFQVDKKIEKAEPKSYQYNINVSYPRRKPKYETRYRTHNRFKIFEMTTAEEKYKDYTPIAPFVGNDIFDLKKNIDTYIEDLMKRINEPLKHCKCCNGTGVIIDNEKEASK